MLMSWSLCVPHYDQETFAERLRTLMRDEELWHRMGQAAEKALHRYDLDVMYASVPLSIQ